MKSERKLGLGSGISICVGLIVATSCLVSLGTGMGTVGRWFIIPLFFVMILNMFVAMSFSELHALMPNVDGGTGQYLLTGAGPVCSIIGNVGTYVIAMIFSMTSELSICGMVFKNLFFPNMDARVLSLIILAVFFLINLRGVDLFARVQNILIILLIGSMVLFGIIGCLKLGNPAHVINYSASAPSFSDINGTLGLMQIAAVAFWLFIGVEFLIPEAKQMKNPKRNVFLAMSLGLVLLFVVQSILGWGMTNYVSLGMLANDPSGLPHMTFAENLLGMGGRYWMGFVTLLAAASSVNTVFASVSKILQGMGSEGMVPKVFQRTNRHGTAYGGLLFICGVIAVMVITNVAAANGITFLILTGSCFWLITYCMIHFTVLKLRHQHPELPRKKWMTLGGLPQVIGIIGNIYMIWNIDSGDARIKIFRVFGIVFVILIVYAFIWVCGVMKVRPFKTVPLEAINKGDTQFEDLIKNGGNDPAHAIRPDLP